jgi:hypothetical protein
MKMAYTSPTFSRAGLQVVTAAEGICDDYAGQGYQLTLRQLYYQFVRRDAFPDDRRFWWNDATGKWIRDRDGINPNSTKNAEPNYNWLGALVNDARLGGYIDWSHIEDRTRDSVGGDSGWSSPAAAIRTIARAYGITHWDGQPEYVEVWVEKEALSDVISRPCGRWDVSYLACKGYLSQSEMHEAAERLIGHEADDQETTIIYLGDHDPSGVDMSRDIQDRLAMFGSKATVDRIALNMDQITDDLPPAPAKITDSRAASYIERFGTDSWELDAIEPAAMDAMVEEAITSRLDMDMYRDRLAREDQEREILDALTQNWADVATHIASQGWLPDHSEDEE